MPEREAGDSIMVLSTKSQVYALMVKEALESEEIPSILKSPMGIYLRGMFPLGRSFFDYRLYVRQEDSQRAGEIVEMILPAEEL